MAAPCPAAVSPFAPSVGPGWLRPRASGIRSLQGVTSARPALHLPGAREHCPVGSEDGMALSGPGLHATPLCCNKESPSPSWEADSFRALRTWDLQQAFAGSSPDGPLPPPAPTSWPFLCTHPISASLKAKQAELRTGEDGTRNCRAPHCSSGQQTRLTHHLAFTCAECPQHLQLPVTLGTQPGGTRRPPPGVSVCGRLPASSGRPGGCPPGR